MKIKEAFIDALPIIEKFAPSVGAAIGGPLGFASGYIIPILASAFDAKPTDIKQLVSNIITDPRMQSKLESIEQDHGDWLSSLTDNLDRLVTAEFNVKLAWAEPK